MNKQEAKKLEQQIGEIFKKQFLPNKQQVKSTANQTKLAKSPKSFIVILGLSGGADSVFLLHQLIKFATNSENIKLKVIAAHLNHQIRGKEADKDAKFVGSLCEKLETASPAQIIPEIHSKDIKKLAQNKNLEEVGRKERYKLFKKLAKKHQASHIITAHHADDNLETMLFNLTRGASLEGLAGMQMSEELPQSIAPKPKGGNRSAPITLFRPLLQISKEEINTYLELHSIPYREDKTNKDTQYSRNYIRHEIIPKLTKLNPNLATTISPNLQNLQQTQEYLDQKSQDWLTREKLNNKFTSFPAKNFLNQPLILQKNILRALHKKHIGHTKNLETKHSEEVLSIIKNNVGRKKKKFGKLEISIDKNQIRISY
jgi:tRNA(Ile)-lysidine synthase